MDAKKSELTPKTPGLVASADFGMFCFGNAKEFQRAQSLSVFAVVRSIVVLQHKKPPSL